MMWKDNVPAYRPDLLRIWMAPCRIDAALILRQQQSIFSIDNTTLIALSIKMYDLQNVVLHNKKYLIHFLQLVYP